MSFYYENVIEDRIIINEKRKDNEINIVYSCLKSENKVIKGKHEYHYVFDYIPDESNNCNSLLVLSKRCNPVTKEQEIRYIGPLLQFTFSIQENDFIKNYYSQVGNDNLIYPVLETNNRIYFINNQLYIEKDYLMCDICRDYIINGYEIILNDVRYKRLFKVFRKRIHS